jgi:hypothetical protein
MKVFCNVILCRWKVETNVIEEPFASIISVKRLLMMETIGSSRSWYLSYELHVVMYQKTIFLILTTMIASNVID